MIIDFHTHAFPDAIARSAMQKLSAGEGNVPHYLDGTVAALVASMDGARIDKSVLLNIATRPGQEPSICKFCISLLSNPRIIPFFSVHPDVKEGVKLIEEAARAGIRGVKIHPYYQGVSLDDARYETIARACADTGLVLLSHTGFDPGYERERIADARKVLRLKQRIPPLKLVAAHFGGFDDWSDLSILADSGVYLETSFVQHFNAPGRVAEMITQHGADMVLFGTDSPWTEQSEEVKKITSLPLDKESIEKITFKNAENLLA